VKFAVLVTLWSILCILCFPSAELTEIFGRPRYYVCEEFHFYAAQGFTSKAMLVMVKMIVGLRRLTTQGDVEKHNWIWLLFRHDEQMSRIPVFRNLIEFTPHENCKTTESKMTIVVLRWYCSLVVVSKMQTWWGLNSMFNHHLRNLPSTSTTHLL
jgi:hypothetical protein